MLFVAIIIKEAFSLSEVCYGTVNLSSKLQKQKLQDSVHMYVHNVHDVYILFCSQKDIFFIVCDLP